MHKPVQRCVLLLPRHVRSIMVALDQERVLHLAMALSVRVVRIVRQQLSRPLYKTIQAQFHQQQFVRQMVDQ